MDTIDTNCFHNKIKTKYLRHASYFPKIDLWSERKQHFMGSNERSRWDLHNSQRSAWKSIWTKIGWVNNYFSPSSLLRVISPKAGGQPSNFGKVFNSALSQAPIFRVTTSLLVHSGTSYPSFYSFQNTVNLLFQLSGEEKLASLQHTLPPPVR